MSDSVKDQKEQKDLDRQLRIARRVLEIKKSRERMIPFAKFMMLHLDDPDDAERSIYQNAIPFSL